MQILPFRPDLIRNILVFVQSLRLWTLELVALWVELFGGREGRIDLRRQLRDLRRQTRMVFFVAAVSRLRILVDRPGTLRPRSAPPGTRYQRRRTRLIRMVTRKLRLKSLADIRAALDDFDALVARAFACMPKRLLFGVIVMGVDGVVSAPLRIVSAHADAHDTS